MAKSNKKYIVKFLIFLNYFFMFVGLANLSIRTTDSKTQKLRFIFVPSRVAIIYSAIVMGLLICLCLAGLYMEYTAVYDYKVSLFQMVDFFQLIMGNSVIVSVLFVHCLKVKQFASILQKMHNASIYLLNLDVLNSTDSLFFYLASVFASNVCLFTIFIISAMTSFPSLLIFFVNFIPNFVTVCLVLQYTIVVRIIFFMFDSVNKGIMKAFRDLAEGQPDEMHGNVDTALNSKYSEILILLQNAHANLCNISEDVTRFYDISILGCIAFMFYTIVVYTYFLLMFALNGDKLFEDSEYIHIGLWDSWLLWALFALSRNVTKTLNEVNRTKNIVFELFKYVKNQEYREMLKDFSQYSMHKKVRFTAMDFFSLECNLITSIIHSVLTYLVILVQFEH